MLNLDMPKPQFQGIITFPILFGIVAAIVILASAAVSATLQAPSGRPWENISKPLCRINPDLAVCKKTSPLPRTWSKPSPDPCLGRNIVCSPSPTPSPATSPNPTSTPSPSGLPAAPTEVATKINCQFEKKYFATVPIMWKNNATNADGFKIAQRKPSENNWTDIATLTAQEALDGPYGYYTWTNPEVNTDYLLKVGAFASNITGINWSDYVTLTTTCP